MEQVKYSAGACLDTALTMAVHNLCNRQEVSLPAPFGETFAEVGILRIHEISLVKNRFARKGVPPHKEGGAGCPVNFTWLKVRREGQVFPQE